MDKFRIFKRVIIAIIIALAILAVGNSSHAAYNIYDTRKYDYQDYSKDNYWYNYLKFDGKYEFYYDWFTYKGNDYIMEDDALRMLKENFLGAHTQAWKQDYKWENGSWVETDRGVKTRDPLVDWDWQSTRIPKPSDYELVLSHYTNIQCLDGDAGQATRSDNNLRLNAIIDINNGGNTPTSAEITYVKKYDYKTDRWGKTEKDENGFLTVNDFTTDSKNSNDDYRGLPSILILLDRI